MPYDNYIHETTPYKELLGYVNSVLDKTPGEKESFEKKLMKYWLVSGRKLKKTSGRTIPKSKFASFTKKNLLISRSNCEISLNNF